VNSPSEPKLIPEKSKKRRLIVALSLFALFIGVIATGFFLSFQSVDSLLWAQRAENLTTVMNGISKTTNLYFEDNWSDLDRLTSRLSNANYADEASLSSALKTIEARLGGDARNGSGDRRARRGGRSARRDARQRALTSRKGDKEECRGNKKTDFGHRVTFILFS
jgi:hypothetical protein